MRPLHELTASAAVELLRRGEITSERLVRACLDRIESVEPRIQAFEAIDPERALRAARRADEAGRPGPLHGLPLGVKDIIDTADLPTSRGSPIFAGRRPSADAECVAALRRGGGIVLGKTVTTEFAFYFPGKTRNPHDLGRTPGGSSSGSAAAVAACMVPAALGTQTAGSLIRPGAYCGVVALKPTHGLLPLGGVSPFAPSLDTLGVLTRSAADLPVLLAGLGAPVPAVPSPVRLRVGLCRTEAWDMTLPASREAVARAARALSAAGAEFAEEEERFEGLSEAQRTVMAAEAVLSLGSLRAEHAGRMSPQVLALLEAGDRVTPEALSSARAAAGVARLPAIFGRFDVLLGASTQGEAPQGLGATGDPALNRIWTLLGLPCVQLPAGRGPEGMPVGIQLIGPRGGEAALCAAAAFAERALGAGARSPTPA